MDFSSSTPIGQPAANNYIQLNLSLNGYNLDTICITCSGEGTVKSALGWELERGQLKLHKLQIELTMHGEKRTGKQNHGIRKEFHLTDMGLTSGAFDVDSNQIY